MPVVHEDAAAWVMRHDILVVDDSPVLGPDSKDKVGEVGVTDTRLAKVVHANLVAGLDQVKSCQKGKSRTETVACGFNCSCWV